MNAVSALLPAAAKLTGVSERTIRRAIATTDPESFPPPLKAYRVGNGPNAALIVRVADLEEWVTRFPPA